MLLAELEVRHSRSIAPTRRVALGSHWLPVEPAPGFGGILIAGVVAAHVDALDDELLDGLLELVDDLEPGRRIPQPRLRHRFQTDVHGLARSRHRLVGDGEAMRLDLQSPAPPVPQLLGALYAASALAAAARGPVFDLVRRAARWDGGVDSELIAYLTGGGDTRPRNWRTFPTDERWARQLLGFGPGTRPARDAVQRRFRTMVRYAHPDHGAVAEGAGQRIVELTEARRILLG